MSTESFIGSVKVKRDEAVESVLSKMIELGNANEALKAPLAEFADSVTGTIDTVVGGVLDVFNEQYDEIITTETEDGTPVLIGCVSDLSTLYFEEVSS